MYSTKKYVLLFSELYVSNKVHKMSFRALRIVIFANDLIISDENCQPGDNIIYR